MKKSRFSEEQIIGKFREAEAESPIKAVCAAHIILCSGCARRGSESFRPSLGSDILDLPVGHRGEPGEHVAQVGVGIDAAAAATLDNGVEDSAALAGIGITEEEPVSEERLIMLSRRAGNLVDKNRLRSDGSA